LRFSERRRKLNAPVKKSKMFTKKFALVTFGESDPFSNGYAVVENPRAAVYHSVTFIEGVHAHDSVEYIRGKRIFVPLANVTSITEFDTTADIFPRRGKKKRRMK
jgi:hypothetical protein